MRWDLLSLITVVFYCTECEADIRLNFTVKDYENKNDLDIRLRKCESLSFFGDYCDPVFQFTVNVINPGDERRLILKKEAGPFKNKKRIGHVLEASSEQRIFPDMVEIDLDIRDNDADEEQRIARFRRQIPFTSPGRYVLPMGADVRVSVTVSLECAANYYGPKCEVYCLPVFALWTCNNLTGARLCSKPCVHGNCVLTNTSAVCLCSFGWLGEFCNRPVESRLIDSMLLPEEPELIVPDYPPVVSSEAAAVETTLMTSPAVTTVEPTTDANVETTTPVPTVEQAEFNNNPSSTTARIVEVRDLSDADQTGDMLEVQQPLEEFQSPTTNNDTEVIALEAVAAVDTQPSTLLIALLIVFVIVIWLAVAGIIVFVCYKRKKLKRKSVYSGSLWTNTTYDSTQPFIATQYVVEHSPPSHKYMNTMNTAFTSRPYTPKAWSTTDRTHSTISSRGTLPQPPSDETDDPVPPPIITGSKIRFAATTVTTLPPKPKPLTETENQKSPEETVNDPYEELIEDGCYLMWDPNMAATALLPDAQNT